MEGMYMEGNISLVLVAITFAKKQSSTDGIKSFGMAPVDTSSAIKAQMA
jgi:hypothetical protein